MATTHTPGTAVFTCPLSSCHWTQTDLQAEGAGYIGMLATEQLLREHLSSHDLSEWVAEVVKLHEAMLKVAELADDWDAKAKMIGGQIQLEDCDGAMAGFKMIGYQNHHSHATALREATAAALTGTEAGDA